MQELYDLQDVQKNIEHNIKTYYLETGEYNQWTTRTKNKTRKRTVFNEPRESSRVYLIIHTFVQQEEV